MYQALYRKWRPQTFDQVVGQEHITQTLKNQVKSGRLSHAYIFIGVRGTGKTTCARILAKAVNCEHPVDGNPCGVCQACRGISDGSVLDVVELDAASNNGVDNVRALRDEAVFSPAAVKKRVYIIDEVHMLSTAAFNALLKILEEPPEHLMFILATTELQKVPATILSRCQRHTFKRIDTGRLAEYMARVSAQEGFKLTDEAAELISRMAEGGVRDALSLLDQCSGADVIDAQAVYSATGLAGNRRIAELLGYILDGDSGSAVREFSAMWMDGKDPASLLNELLTLMRDIMISHIAPKNAMELSSGGYGRETLADFSRRMTVEELLCAMDTVQRAMSGMRDMKNPRTAAELCLVSLCDNTMGDSVQAIKARLSRLEQAMERGEMPVPSPESPGSCRAETEDSMEDDDELPEVFVEEQPEDVFFARESREEPQQEQPAGEVPAERGVLWSDVCARAAIFLPMDVRLNIEDNKKVTGRVEGDILKIQVIPGFLYDRFKHGDVLARLSEAASMLAGRELRPQLSELADQPREKRSLEELKQFKEVRFI